MSKSVEELTARQSLAEVSRLCYQRGYISGTEGNFSIRLSENQVLTTPRGVCKGRINESELVLTDLHGNALDPHSALPSTELKMHLAAYRLRKDIDAVVHAHPTIAVGFTVAGVSLSTPALPEVVCTLGGIPVAPYATPSTEEVVESIEPFVKKCDALMLDHHGALCLGKDIWDAFYKLETVEHQAQTLLVAHLLGGPKPLSTAQISCLMAVRSVYGLTNQLDVDYLTEAASDERK
ncbi:MAG: class II aldolase/adducin family protein [Candidatus Melainabacteria bacterium]|nr:class II aldolase/adducin family protein [Candidatus Melainabacteria bacterium]